MALLKDRGLFVWNEQLTDQLNEQKTVIHGLIPEGNYCTRIFTGPVTVKNAPVGRW